MSILKSIIAVFLICIFVCVSGCTADQNKTVKKELKKVIEITKEIKKLEEAKCAAEGDTKCKKAVKIQEFVDYGQKVYDSNDVYTYCDALLLAVELSDEWIRDNYGDKLEYMSVWIIFKIELADYCDSYSPQNDVLEFRKRTLGKQ